MIFMNKENSKANEPQKIVLNLSQKLDLRNSIKDVTLQNMSKYYTWKNIKQRYKNKKLKIIGMMNLNSRWFLLGVRCSRLYQLYHKKSRNIVC